MGFNTVAFLLNDHMRSIEESPQTVSYLLSHPQIWENKQYLNIEKRNCARDFDEPTLHSQALEVLPTFHANYTYWYQAGGNCIDSLKFVKRITIKGKRCVVLELPEWEQRNEISSLSRW